MMKIIAIDMGFTLLPSLYLHKYEDETEIIIKSEEIVSCNDTDKGSIVTIRTIDGYNADINVCESKKEIEAAMALASFYKEKGLQYIKLLNQQINDFSELSQYLEN